MITHGLLKVFGLEETSSTVVGNDFVHGVSGGERKRVSLAEVVSKTPANEIRGFSEFWANIKY